MEQIIRPDPDKITDIFNLKEKRFYCYLTASTRSHRTLQVTLEQINPLLVYGHIYFEAVDYFQGPTHWESAELCIDTSLTAVELARRAEPSIDETQIRRALESGTWWHVYYFNAEKTRVSILAAGTYMILAEE